MALETRPLPVLEGQALEDFYKTLAKSKENRSKEELQEIDRKMRAMLERSRAKGYVI